MREREEPGGTQLVELPLGETEVTHMQTSFSMSTNTDTGSTRVSAHTCTHMHPHAHTIPHAGPAPPRPLPQPPQSQYVPLLPPSETAPQEKSQGVRALPWHTLGTRVVGAGAAGNFERMPPIPPSPDRPHQMVPPQGLPPVLTAPGPALGQPGQAHVSQDPFEASAPAAQHPPLPPVPDWARLGRSEASTGTAQGIEDPRGDPEVKGMSPAWPLKETEQRA